MEERIQYSDIDLTIKPLSIDDKSQIESFSCACVSLDRFFHEEIYICAKHHYISAYCAKNINNGEIIAVFTLANDSVVIDNIDREEFISESCAKISEEYISTFERQTSFPAINIGHLGVRADLQCKGIGEQIIDFVVYTFANFKISGCQYITVDSLNNPRTNRFYMKYGFLLQTNNDFCLETRRMYLPIQIYK